jgi:translation initiation factor 1 (eIF-1/SUI1)
MDPFETHHEISSNSGDITIWMEVIKNKKNTYLVGWDLTENELKEHAKTFKKKHGCNGTVKEIDNEGKPMIGLHLQGDHVNKLETYLNNLGIKNIVIKN